MKIKILFILMWACTLCCFANLNDFANPGASLSSASVSLSGENAGDKAGGKVIDAGDVNGDSISDILIAATDNDDAGADAGKVYLIYGSSSGSYSLSTADVTFIGENAGDSAGNSLGVGDINGDGLSDILIGAKGNDDGGSAAGKVYLIYGASTLSGSYDLSTADTSFIGESIGDNAGHTLVTGDIDGDGYDDILIAAPYSGAGGSTGKIYLIYGASTLSGSYDLSTADANFVGEATYYSGIALATGDFNGDGYDDILISAMVNNGPTWPGRIFLYYGSLSLSGSYNLLNAPDSMQGQNNGNLAGSSLAVGDVNGDGYDDMLIGSYINKAYLLYGAAVKNYDLSTADVVLMADVAGETLSGCLSSIKDFDGDGLSDILIGARYLDAAKGKSYLFLGSGISAGTVNTSMASHIFIGENDGDHAGSVEIVENFNGDSASDILIGAVDNDDTGMDAGKIYLIFGQCHNYLANGTAEQGTAFWKVYGSATTEIDSDEHFMLPFEGDYLYQDISIPAGSSMVKISAQVRVARPTVNEGFPYLYAYVMDNSNYILAYLNTLPSTSKTWTQVSTIHTLTASATKIRVFLKRSSKKGYSEINRAYFDDVAVNFDCGT